MQLDETRSPCRSTKVKRTEGRVPSDTQGFQHLAEFYNYKGL